MVYRRSREGHKFPMPNPAVKIYTEHGRELARLAGKFGLTPSDRANLAIVDAEAAAAEDAFRPPQGRKQKPKKTG